MTAPPNQKMHPTKKERVIFSRGKKIMYDEQEIEQEIESLQKDGHTFHCSVRILTGDGECECGKTSTTTPGISSKLYGHKCAVCLCDGATHKDWCRIGKELGGKMKKGSYCEGPSPG